MRVDISHALEVFHVPSLMNEVVEMTDIPPKTYLAWKAIPDRSYHRDADLDKEYTYYPRGRFHVLAGIAVPLSLSPHEARYCHRSARPYHGPLCCVLSRLYRPDGAPWITCDVIRILSGVLPHETLRRLRPPRSAPGMSFDIARQIHATLTVLPHARRGVGPSSRLDRIAWLDALGSASAAWCAHETDTDRRESDRDDGQGVLDIVSDAYSDASEDIPF